MALLHAVFLDSVKASIQHGPLAVITAAGQRLTTLKDAFAALLDEAGATAKERALGKGESEQQVLSWLQEPEPATPESIKKIDQALANKTFLVGNSLTAADVAVFGSLHSYVAKSSRAEQLSHPNLTRHFDLIQHIQPVASVLLSKNIFEPSQVAIDLDNIPAKERKAEPKPDKKKAKAAASAAAPEAAAPAKQGKSAAAASSEPKPDKPKKEKKDKPAKEKAPAAPAVDNKPMPHMIDLRVGKIIEVKRHPDADSLYVEQIDVGEAEPRTVVSGLVKYIPIEQMQDRLLVAVCNLKPASMRGIKSYAMVLAASPKEGKDTAGVELCQVPEGSQPGDRVYFEGFENEKALELLNPKKKIFETVQPGLTTLETREAAWVDPTDATKVYKLRTDKGVIKAPTFIGASLS